MSLRRLLLGLAWVSGMAALSGIDYYHRGQLRLDLNRQIEAAFDDTKEALEVGIRLRILAVEELRAFILSLPSVPDHAVFERFASLSLDNFPEVRALQYVDVNHVIRFAYPIAGNEDAIGLDLMTRPAAPFVLRAIETRDTTLNDPTVTVQGALAVVARSPIYQGDEYLGLAQGVFEIDALLEEASGMLSRNVALHLEDASGRTFRGSPGASHHIVRGAVRVGDRPWNLAVYWIGPPPRPGGFVLFLIWGLGSAAVVGILFGADEAWRRMTGLSEAVEKKTAELEASERRFRVLFEQANEGIMIADAVTNRVVYANPAICTMLGFPLEQITASTVDDVLGEQPAIAARRPVEVAARNERCVVPGVQCRRADASVVIADISWSQMDFDGRNYLAGFVFDITERRRAEEKSREDSAKLQLAVQAARIGLWDWNLVTNQVYFSPEWKKQIGYLDEEVPNRYEAWESRLHPEEREQILAWLREAIGPPWREFSPEFRFRHRDGSYRWILVLSEVLRDEKGIPCRMMGCHIDITDRRKAEAERARLVLALESAADAVLVTDARGTVEFSNAAFELMTGLRRDAVVGKSVKGLAEGILEKEVYRDMRRTVIRGALWSGLVTLRQADGAFLEGATTITPVTDERGRIVSYVGIVRDVTDQRKFEERLRQAQKLEAIGTLAGGIAHDFNNILAAIIGYGELVQAQLDPSGQKAADLGHVLAAAHRAESLVKQILTFSRRTEDTRQPVDLRKVLTEAMNLLRPSLPATIDITTEIALQIDLVLADPTQMHQVVVNLCTNAYQAMEEKGGYLRVALDNAKLDSAFCAVHPEVKPGEYVMLSVTDTGTGMDKATLTRIFEPFYTTKSQGKGSGLGLSTAHGIVESHGGCITVDSEPGRGTTFTVYLPRGDEQVPRSPDPDTPIRGGSERILIVDDEVSLAHVLQKSLQKFGYEVVALTDSVAALEVIRLDPALFDLLVTDLTMPRMTGRQLAAEVQAIRADLPIILITGFTDESLAEQLARLGVAALLTKPTNLNVLARAVRDVLDRVHSNRMSVGPGG